MFINISGVYKHDCLPCCNAGEQILFAEVVWMMRSTYISCYLSIRFTVWKSRWMILNLLIFEINYNSVRFPSPPY